MNLLLTRYIAETDKRYLYFVLIQIDLPSYDFICRINSTAPMLIRIYRSSYFENYPLFSV